VKTVLIVCHANTCRSVMAHVLLQQMLAERQPASAIRVSSGGVGNTARGPPSSCVSLYRLTLPDTTGTPSARHASRMPSIASRNCAMMTGRSGLPKFKQSVRPIGSPPAHTTLRHASATAIAAPCFGSSSQNRPLQSDASATNFSRRPFSSSQNNRTTAPSPAPGRTTVPSRGR
jgi:hypothetical protein